MSDILLKVLLPTFVIWSAFVLLIVQTSVPHILPWNKPKIGSEWHARNTNPFASQPRCRFVVNEVKAGWVSGVMMYNGDWRTYREQLPVSTLLSTYKKAKA